MRSRLDEVSIEQQNGRSTPLRDKRKDWRRSDELANASGSSLNEDAEITRNNARRISTRMKLTESKDGPGHGAANDHARSRWRIRASVEESATRSPGDPGRTQRDPAQAVAFLHAAAARPTELYLMAACRRVQTTHLVSLLSDSTSDLPCVVHTKPRSPRH